MSARVPAPGADGLLYVALVSNDGGDWVPALQPLGGFRQHIEAVHSCSDRLAMEYRAIENAARVLRALCDHHEFEFDGACIDADMVRDHVRRLFELIRAQSPTVHRLLDLPSPRDVVRVDGVRMAADDTGCLSPWVDAQDKGSDQ